MGEIKPAAAGPCAAALRENMLTRIGCAVRAPFLPLIAPFREIVQAEQTLHDSALARASRERYVAKHTANDGYREWRHPRHMVSSRRRR